MSEATSGWFTPEDFPEGSYLTPTMGELEAGAWLHHNSTMSSDSFKMACVDWHEQEQHQTAKSGMVSAAQDQRETHALDTASYSGTNNNKKRNKSKSCSCTIM